MAETRISIRVTEADKEKWECAAKSEGITFTEYVKQGLDIRTGLDPQFWASIQRLANALRYDPVLVLQNLAIEALAHLEAGRESEPDAAQVLPMFIVTNQGTVTGDPLFQMRKAAILAELKKEFAQREDLLHQQKAERLASLKKGAADKGE